LDLSLRQRFRVLGFDSVERLFHTRMFLFRVDLFIRTVLDRPRTKAALSRNNSRNNECEGARF
jgi:hypothetical protein